MEFLPGSHSFQQQLETSFQVHIWSRCPPTPHLKYSIVSPLVLGYWSNPFKWPPGMPASQALLPCPSLSSYFSSMSGGPPWPPQLLCAWSEPLVASILVPPLHGHTSPGGNSRRAAAPCTALHWTCMEYLLHTRHCAESFMATMESACSGPMNKAPLVCPSHGWGNWGLEKSSNLPTVIQLVSGIWTQVCPERKPLTSRRVLHRGGCPDHEH